MMEFHDFFMSLRINNFFISLKTYIHPGNASHSTATIVFNIYSCLLLEWMFHLDMAFLKKNPYT